MCESLVYFPVRSLPDLEHIISFPISELSREII